MSTTISITLSDLDASVLGSIAVDPGEWINNLVASRVGAAAEKIVVDEVTYLIGKNIPVPQTRDAIMQSALNGGRVAPLTPGNPVV